MQYRKYVTATVGPYSENYVNALISTQSEQKRVIAVVPGTSSNNVDLIVYVEREKIIDYPVDLLNSQERLVPLDLDLPVGQQLYVGFRNKTNTAITADVGIIYEVKR
jgi:LEA14-like dessication related protein